MFNVLEVFLLLWHIFICVLLSNFCCYSRGENFGLFTLHSCRDVIIRDFARFVKVVGFFAPEPSVAGAAGQFILLCLLGLCR